MSAWGDSFANRKRRWLSVVIRGAAAASCVLAAISHAFAVDAEPLTACIAPFVIDFAGLPAGTVLGEQYAAQGVHISAAGNGSGPNAAIVFDSNAAPTHDPDLAVGIGNLAILALNLNDANSNGLVDDPDENNAGGKQVYWFDQDVNIGSFKFIDKDHGSPDKAIAYDATNSMVAEVAIPVSTNGSVQTIEVNADSVRRLEIIYRDSAAVTGIEVNCSQQPTPTPSPTASPSPSPTPIETASATPVPSVSPSPSPTPLLIQQTASPTPTDPAGVLTATELPSGGGAFGLTERPVEVLLLAATLALLLLEFAVLRAGRR
jgi:hypothetical protein